MFRKLVLLFYVTSIFFLWTNMPAMAESPPLQLNSNDENYSLFFNFQYRPRYEYNDNKDFQKNTKQDFISHRARLTFTGTYQDFLEIVFQVQDVRIWGSETDTLGDFSANGFDFHQGYALLKHDDKCFLKLGRQEIVFDGQRLIGSVNWAQQARAFDAIKAYYKRTDYQVTGAYAKVLEDDSGVNNNADLFILHGSLKPFDTLYTSLIVIWDGSHTPDSSRWTIGPYFQFNSGGFHSVVEGYGQFGNVKNGMVQDYCAFLAAGRAGYTFDNSWKPTIDVWFDYLSGDDDPTDGKIKVFDTLFATNHKYYGNMDFFLNIPVHTGGLGLMDAGLMAKIKPHKYLIYRIDFHQFWTAKDTLMGNNNLGFEIDFIQKTPLPKGITVTCGFSTFFRGNAMADLRNNEESTEFFGFVMADLKI